MIDSGTRPPISFDPAAAELPEGMLLPPRKGGEVVALLVDPGMGMAGWSLRVGRALARGWARSERDVVLIDAHVEEPALHQLLGTENGEGLTDAVEFGVSSSRVTRRLDGEPFAFVSAGTVLPHHREFWRSRRWGALLNGYRKEDRIVLLYLPGGDPDIGGIVRSADRSFWVGRDDAPELSGQADARVIVPASAPDAAEARRSERVVDERFSTPSGLTGAAQNSLAPKPEANRPAGGDRVGKARQDPTPARPATTSGPSSAPAGGRRMPGLLLVLVLILGGAVIGHWFGFFTIPGLPVRVDPGPSSLFLTPFLSG